MGAVELAEFVSKHAMDHYEESGWSVLVECWTTEEIVEQLQRDGAATQTEALKSFESQVDYWGEQFADAKNSAF